MTPDLPKTLCLCWLGDGSLMCDCLAQMEQRQAQEELFVDAHRAGDE